MNADIVAFKRQLESRETNGLVIDIDETVSWTQPQLVRELLKLFGNPRNLSVEEACESMARTRELPFEKPEAAIKWIVRALNSEERVEEYPIVKGSSEAVERIDRIIPIVGYLTLRRTRVRNATKRWLNKHGFPDAPVITRPNNLKTGEGMKWKARTLAYLYPQVIGIIDDNPDILDHLPSSYKGTIFLYGNPDYAGGDLDVVPCGMWDDVYMKVVEHQASLERTAGRARPPDSR